MNDQRPRISTDSTHRPMSARSRGWELNHGVARFNTHSIPGRDDIKSAHSSTEEKRQLNLIMAELRKELTRMEHDEWRYPTTNF